MLRKKLISLLIAVSCLGPGAAPGFAQKTLFIEIEARHNNYDGPGDPVGEQVVQHLKELIKKSGSLTLTADQEERLKVIIHTFDPLSQKTHLFTVLSYTFVFLKKPQLVPVYLTSGIGYAHRNDVPEAAQQLHASINKVAQDLIKSPGGK